MVTMNEKYGDGSDHEACKKCGFCITCGDCDRDGCGKQKTALDVLMAINEALSKGMSPAEVLDENSPIMDAMRDVLTHNTLMNDQQAMNTG